MHKFADMHGKILSLMSACGRRVFIFLNFILSFATLRLHTEHIMLVPAKGTCAMCKALNGKGIGAKICYYHRPSAQVLTLRDLQIYL